MRKETHEIVEFLPNMPIKIFIHKLGFVAKHWHKSLEIIMILDGEVVISVNGDEYNLKSEDVFVINPSSIHEIRSESAVIIAVQINLTKLKKYDSELSDIVCECNSCGDTFNKKYNKLRYIIANLIHSNAAGAGTNNYKVYTYIFAFISTLVENFSVADTGEFKGRQKHMERLTRIIDYIDTNYASNFSLSDLAESENLSVPYLSNFFDKYMNVKFSEYYINVKLTHAIDDLVNTDLSIEEIAIKNGFTESHSFVRSFKKNYNIVPSAYRKKMKQQGEKPKENLNYLLIEPSNYLHLLTKYLNRNEEHESNLPTQNFNINVRNISSENNTKKLTHNFKKMTSVGRARDLLNHDIRQMLIDFQKNIGFEYIKFHGIFGDDMMVVSRNGNGELKFNFMLVDNAIDFLLSINLKPLIQLSFMPKILASNIDKTIFFSPLNTSPPKKMSEWTLLVSKFIHHLIERYGIDKVKSWLFCLWNEPDTPSTMFGFERQSDFFKFYKETYDIVKNISSELVFGSPSILKLKGDGATFAPNFLNFAKKNDCFPDFYNIHYYSDIIPTNVTTSFFIGKATSSSFPKNTNAFTTWLDQTEIFLENFCNKKIPVYLTEWNFTLSHRNLINDTCFKSCYILKNLLENYDRLDSFGYWTLTDLTEEHSLPSELFHGGLGVYTLNGIRKNTFYAFKFASMLGDDLIAQGDGYFITKKGDEYQIITYNYLHYGNLFASGELFDVTQAKRYSPFNMNNRLTLNLELIDILNGNYEISEQIVNQDYGSAFDLWVNMGGRTLDQDELEILSRHSTPKLHKYSKFISGNQISYNATLEPLEIRFAKIKRTDYQKNT